MPLAPFEHPLPGLSPTWQVVIGTTLGIAGVALLLPRPRHRQLAIGTFLVIAAGVVLGLFVATTFGGPGRDEIHDRIYAGLFWLFTSVAVSFAVVMVAQRNPARGAMAFAVSVLATCGLFLLLAAPFLMAATVVVYAGATIVTFLFVLMLSHTGGPSDENDRSREPILGTLGGLGFAGLALFTLYLGSPAKADENLLPATPLTADEQRTLEQVGISLRQTAIAAPESLIGPARSELARLGPVVGYAEGQIAPAGSVALSRGSIQVRLKPIAGVRATELVAAADALQRLKSDSASALDRATADPKQVDAARLQLQATGDAALVLAGRAELPARNVASIGFLLYSEHLLAVELAGTLLLVATVGAVAVAGRRTPA